MKLEKFEYAKEYIREGTCCFRRLRRLSEVSNRKYEQATNISPLICRETEISYNFNPNVIENKIVDMIYSKQLCDETFHECIGYCKTLNVIDDETGSMILFYYFFLNVSIADISKQLFVGRKTCYRHLNKAVSQLDDYLRESGNYKIKSTNN